MKRFFTVCSLLACMSVAGAQDTIQPTDNLVVEGIPAIRASLAEEVRKYTESRAASFLDWHPTRREMLIGTRFGNSTQVHWLKMPMGQGRKSRFTRSRLLEPPLSQRTGTTLSLARIPAEMNSDSFIDMTSWMER